MNTNHQQERGNKKNNNKSYTYMGWRVLLGGFMRQPTFLFSRKNVSPTHPDSLLKLVRAAGQYFDGIKDQGGEPVKIRVDDLVALLKLVRVVDEK